MNKYEKLHSKLVDGLVAANTQEYIGVHGMDAFGTPSVLEARMPYLHSMVKMLASCVVKIVMDWEREESVEKLEVK